MPTLTGRITEHFGWHEAECHSTPPVPVPPEYQDNARAVCREAERIRRVCGNKPLAMSCLYRTPLHNAGLDPPGAKRSQHLTANAADILPPGEMTTEQLARVVQMLAEEPESRIRYVKAYMPSGHVHFDLRPGRHVIVEGL